MRPSCKNCEASVDELTIHEYLITYLEAAAQPPSDHIELHMSVTMRFCERIGYKNLALAAKAMVRFIGLSKGVHEVLDQYNIAR